MRLLKYENLIELASILHENGYGDCGITIEIEVPNQEMLDKLNEDFFYRSHMNKDNKDLKPEEVGIISVNAAGIKFVYKLAKNGDSQ